MSRGIIRNNGSGGVGGKLVITDFDPKLFAKAISPGVEVLFASKDAVKEGYLVQGDLVDDGKGNFVFAVTAILDSNPTIISAPMSGNVTIGTDIVYVVTDAGEIKGNVSVNGGVLVVMGGKAAGNISIGSNSTIICNTGATVSGGTFQINGSGTNASVVITDSTVNGQFSTKGITYVCLSNNTHNGTVKSDSDNYVVITNNTISGNNNLEVSAVVTECSVKNNTVGGKTVIDPKCQV